MGVVGSMGGGSKIWALGVVGVEGVVFQGVVVV